MKTIFLTLVLILFSAINATAQDAWFERAEASAIDYKIPNTKVIPSGDMAEEIKLSIDDVTNLAPEETADISTVDDAITTGPKG